MADKMMRIAGRGEDGTAKAIQTDNAGRLIFNNQKNTVVHKVESLSIPPGEYGWITHYLGMDTLGSRTSVCLVFDKTVPFRLQYQKRLLYTNDILQASTTAREGLANKIIHEHFNDAPRIGWVLWNDSPTETINVHGEVIQFL